MKTFAVLAAALIVVLIGALLFVYSGLYNVAASEPHAGLTTWVLHTTMEESVKRHARVIRAPELGSPQQVQMGFNDYREMCVSCHGAPGVAPDGLGQALNPKASDLAQAAKEWTPSELYWILKHGIKMSGMPAWGKTHSDEALWALVAFVKQLPSLSPEAYRAMDHAAGAEESRSEHH